MSHISTKFCSTSKNSCEAQTELPKPVFTYVLVQCLKTLWLESQGKPRCSTCLKILIATFGYIINFFGLGIKQKSRDVFELGEELRKMFFRLVTSVGQKNSESP